jgi:hypothetical protein
VNENLDKRVIQEEMINMASLSSRYIKEHKQVSEKKKTESAMFKALEYSIGIDTNALLIAADIGIDRLPVMYSFEAEA